MRITSVFARYSHDGNCGFGPNGGPQLSFQLAGEQNWSDQSILGATSTLKPTLVNDFRFSYAFWSNRNLFPNSSDCSGCLGLDGPQIHVCGRLEQRSRWAIHRTRRKGAICGASPGRTA